MNNLSRRDEFLVFTLNFYWSGSGLDGIWEFGLDNFEFLLGKNEGMTCEVLSVTKYSASLVFNFSLFDIELLEIIIIHYECTPRGTPSGWLTPLSFVN